MTKVAELEERKRAIKTRRSIILATLRQANDQLRGIDAELIAVDLDIRQAEREEDGTA